MIVNYTIQLKLTVPNDTSDEDIRAAAMLAMTEGYPAVSREHPTYDPHMCGCWLMKAEVQRRVVYQRGKA